MASRDDSTSSRFAVAFDDVHGDPVGELHHFSAEDRLPIRRPPWSPDCSCQFSFLTASEPSDEGRVRPLIHNGLLLWIELHPCVPRPLSDFGGLSAIRCHTAERRLWENLSEEQRVSSSRPARQQVALSLCLCDLPDFLPVDAAPEQVNARVGLLEERDPIAFRRKPRS